MTKYLTAKCGVTFFWILKQTIQRRLLECVKEGLDTDDMRTAKIKQNAATTASSAIDWDESGHLKQALFSL